MHQPDDDFELEISDLPNDGTRTIGTHIAGLWTRLRAHVPELHINTTPAEASDEEDDCTFDLSIRDLPVTDDTEITPSTFPKNRFWRTSRNKKLLALGTLLLILLILLPTSVPLVRSHVPFLSSTPPKSAQTAQEGISLITLLLGQSPSAGIDTGSSILVGVDTIIGPVPTNCQTGASVSDAHTIGQSPVWLSSFDGPEATLHLGKQPLVFMNSEIGWTTVVTIWMHFVAHTQVTFTGGNQQGTGPNPLFKFNPEDDLTSSISFNSWHTSIPDYNGNLSNNWFMTLFIPQAGCYTLDASWPGGGWHLNFAAGQ